MERKTSAAALPLSFLHENAKRASQTQGIQRGNTDAVAVKLKLQCYPFASLVQLMHRVRRTQLCLQTKKYFTPLGAHSLALMRARQHTLQCCQRRLVPTSL